MKKYNKHSTTRRKLLKSSLAGTAYASMGFPSILRAEENIKIGINLFFGQIYNIPPLVFGNRREESIIWDFYVKFSFIQTKNVTHYIVILNLWQFN